MSASPQEDKKKEIQDQLERSHWKTLKTLFEYKPVTEEEAACLRECRFALVSRATLGAGAGVLGSVLLFRRPRFARLPLVVRLAYGTFFTGIATYGAGMLAIPSMIDSFDRLPSSKSWLKQELQRVRREYNPVEAAAVGDALSKKPDIKK